MSDIAKKNQDIRPEISFADLREIDIEPYQDLPLSEIANHIRSLADKASIGQLRQILDMGVHDQEFEREELIEKFTQKKMQAVIKMKEIIDSME